MGLPGQGVEHAPDGDAGQGTVVVVQAKVDAVKRGRNAQGCETKGKAVRSGVRGTCRRNLSSLPHNIKMGLSVLAHAHAEKRGGQRRLIILEL